jgi:sulfur-oxidizing protein SoxY
VPSRREALIEAARVASLLAAVGLLPSIAHAAWPKNAFDARRLADVVQALGGQMPVPSDAVTLTGPDMAEDGAAVQLTVASALPGLRRLLIVVEKNPGVLAAVFEPSAAVEPTFTTRIKMNESSNVYAVAMTADGRAHFARKDIRVTLGACG